MNLMKELCNKPWFRRSCPAVKNELLRLTRWYPMHMKPDMRWLDEDADLACVAKVVCLNGDERRELFYYELATTEKHRDMDGKWHEVINVRKWVCS